MVFHLGKRAEEEWRERSGKEGGWKDRGGIGPGMDEGKDEGWTGGWTRDGVDDWDRRGVHLSSVKEQRLMRSTAVGVHGFDFRSSTVSPSAGFVCSVFLIIVFTFLKSQST